ncbi:Rrf2 family transcriptional regulator [Candidatus Acetothermia bacterium]|jgi:Rrf2 family protein|nr:Rrf2 family transcriptional regulator [Candidatus Acetothermia bacterium]
MTRLLKISDATALGLHTMVYLAESPDGFITTSEIATYLRASEAHLAKVLQRLTKAGLIKSTRGPKGGFTLVEGGEKTSLLTIYQLLEGPFPSLDCLFPAPICNNTDCIMGGLLNKLSREIQEYLATTTIMQLVKGGKSVTNQKDSKNK